MSENAIKIEEAEQIDNGVLITFSDGRTALYSAPFLYSNISAAEEIWNEDDDALEA